MHIPFNEDFKYYICSQNSMNELLRLILIIGVSFLVAGWIMYVGHLSNIHDLKDQGALATETSSASSNNGILVGSAFQSNEGSTTGNVLAFSLIYLLVLGFAFAYIYEHKNKKN